MLGSEQILPWVGGPQVDSNHGAHALLFLVVIGIGKHGAGDQHRNPQQLHDSADQITFSTKSEEK